MKKICKLTTIIFVLTISIVMITGCRKTASESAATTTAPPATQMTTTAASSSSNKGGTVEGNIEEYSIPIKLINSTGIEVYGIYASISEADSWEENLLQSGVLEDGYYTEITFKFNSDQTVWDFALEDYEGDLLEFYDIDFDGCSTDGITLEFTFDESTGKGTVYWE